jgi:hypothetical protein
MIKTRWIAPVAGVMLVLAGCGGDDDDFANNPRPPAPIELTGVITKQKVTVSPDRVGAGPIVLIVSNQSEDSRTLTLEGEQVRERVGPIAPLDTAQIQRTLRPGRYEVKAGSERALAREIEPAALAIGKERKSSSGETLLP